jgi:hypothetical protein
MVNQPATLTKFRIRRNWLVYGSMVVVSAIAVLIYVGFSASIHTVGFPLDDSWIHQTYARNLAQRGEWAFVPGIPSAGSTSPLWTALLAGGYLISSIPYAWTYFLGMLSLSGLAYFGERLFGEIEHHLTKSAPVAGIFLAIEWHLVWAAASGMETILFAFGIVLIFFLLAQRRSNWGWIGFLIGACAWVRPDGVTLMGPAFFILIFSQQAGRVILNGGIRLSIGFATGFLPYIFFNRMVSGGWFPNTFYAKQAEYAIYQQIPLLERFISLAVLPLIGAGVLLLPGMLYVLWASIKRRHALLLAMALWWFGYTGLYAVKLPLAYQHGRYLMPAMPVYFILGLVGTVWLLRQIPWRGRLQFIGTCGTAAAIASVSLAFFVVGANVYGRDVGVIDTEMVRTAHWVAAETDQDALIAAHDIGALGFFGQRQLVDLAGLISPEVIPFIRDETRLEAYLDEKKIDYLVTFPDWYPQLIQRGEAIYTTGGTFAIEAGGENMVVYRWRAGRP